MAAALSRQADGTILSDRITLRAAPGASASGSPTARSMWALVCCAALLWIATPTRADAGWGARKKKPPTSTITKKKTKSRRARRRRVRRRRATKPPTRTSRSPRNAKAQVKAAVSDRADALLRARRWSPRAAIRLMREAVAGREMSTALRLAQAVAAAKRVPPADLVDAATILGQDQRYPIQLKLWQRVGKSRRVPRWLRRTVDEGWFDALMAAKKHKEARAVLKGALRRARIGTRFSLYERLVAWGRVTDEVDAARETLLDSRDPDAAVLAARLVAELDGDDAAVTLLRNAFKRYPGHRALQKALIDALVRQGGRAELAKVVGKVVRLSPGDPMPWLKVVDAHILARDKRAARKLIDQLVGRYRRHDVLIESLIDREQRLGEDIKRLTRLFEALIRANPKNPSYLEAYGEWLLTRGSRQIKEAMRVLTRLRKLPQGPYEGMRRMAGILQAHGHVAEAQALLLKMKQQFPKRRETLRLLAILFGQTGRASDAERGWLALIVLPTNPDAEQRRLAADARRSLISLYRKTGWLPNRLAALQKRLQSGDGSLGDVLLHLDLIAGEAEMSDQRLAMGWLDGSHPMTKTWGKDVEVSAALTQAELRRNRLGPALRRLQRLAAVDPDGARPLLVALVERALRAQNGDLVAKAESILIGGGRVVTSQLLRLGDLHMRSGDTEGASALYRRAARENPRDTRAILRLARMFRQRGKTADEAASLRAIVLRTVDADELNRAGQRLLTLAMGDGSSADLLRWLDAVTPKHPRRSVIERFRLLAYDVWLRSAPLERLLGHRGVKPGPAMLTEAMGSGDLAIRVRALRQSALAHRRVAPPLARRLLKDDNAAIRRLTVLALAASGSIEATKVLIEMEAERNWQVRVAQLLAFAQLPSLPEAEPFLVSRLQERNTKWSALAALAIGRVGGEGAVGILLDNRRTVLRTPLLIALGALIGRMPTHGKAADVVSHLALWAQPPRGARLLGYFEVYAALWALAATGRKDARDVLLQRAVEFDSKVLRGVALRLAGAVKPPTLEVAHWRVPINWSSRENVANGIERNAIVPWLNPAPARLSAALARVDGDLAPRLAARFDSPEGERLRRGWCGDVEGLLSGAPKIAKVCAASAIAVKTNIPR